MGFFQSKTFEIITYISIIVPSIINTRVMYVALKNRHSDMHIFYSFFPISFLSVFWLFAYSLRIFGRVSVTEYFELVMPLAPVAFITVWVLPGLMYLSLKKVQKNGKH